MNIDEIRQILQKNIAEFQLVKLKTAEVAMDATAYQCEAEIVPDGIDCLITITQNDAIESGIKEGQVWVCLFYKGNTREGYAIRRMITQPDPLHEKSKEGHTVVRSLQDKKIYLSNKRDATLEENAVLGQELKKYLKEIVTEIRALSNAVNTVNQRAWQAATWGIAANTPAGALGIAPTATPELLKWIGAEMPYTPEKIAELALLDGDLKINKILSDLTFHQEKSS